MWDYAATWQVARSRSECLPALHDLLIERAADQGVSLNALMVALLAGGTGFKLPEA